MLQKYKNIGGIATKRLIWYMETILSSSYSLFYASLSSFCSCCFSWLCNDIVHCWRHNAARLAFAFLIWSSMCMCIQCKSFHVSNFSAFRIFAKHSNQRVLYIYIFYGNVCLYIILIVPSDRCLDDADAGAIAVFCCFFFHRDASCGFAMARFAPIKWRTLLSGWCGVRTYIQYMVEIMV